MRKLGLLAAGAVIFACSGVASAAPPSWTFQAPGPGGGRFCTAKSPAISILLDPDTSAVVFTFPNAELPKGSAAGVVRIDGGAEIKVMFNVSGKVAGWIDPSDQAWSQLEAGRSVSLKLPGAAGSFDLAGFRAARAQAMACVQGMRAAAAPARAPAPEPAPAPPQHAPPPAPAYVAPPPQPAPQPAPQAAYVAPPPAPAPQPAYVPPPTPTYAPPPPASAGMDLSCQGTARYAATSSGMAFNNRGGSVTAFGTSWDQSQEFFVVSVQGATVKVRPPSVLIPIMRGGGAGDGWWQLKDVRIDDYAISGKWSYNVLNNPSMRIDRRSGSIEVSGYGFTYRGTCDRAADTPATRRF